MGTIFTSISDHFFINVAAEVIPAIPPAGKRKEKNGKEEPINAKL